jgi:hypothetical protein
MAWKCETSSWIGVDGEPSEFLSIVHPLEDLIEHDVDNLRCACVPFWKITIGYHEREGCLCVLNEVVHHSLDGRELSE